VHWNRLVFAGEYLKTHTRVPCAEGACESGRDAANAVISHARAVGKLASPARRPKNGSRSDGQDLDPVLAAVWNPEASEIKDVEPLRQLDDWCARERLPHPFELAGLDNWISLVSWFGALYPVSEPFLRSILEKLRTVAPPTDGNLGSTGYQEAALDILKRLREALERAQAEQPAG
jgi:hypothetical protein